MKRYRNAKYLAWVRSLPCFLCGGLSGEAHHIKGIGHLSGAGLKASDVYVMPLCNTCHGDMHRKPELWPTQWEGVARTLAKAVEEGIL